MQRLDLVGTVTGTRFAVPAGQIEIVAGGTAAAPMVTVLNHVTGETVTLGLSAGETATETGLSVHGNGRVALSVDGVAGSVLAEAVDAARAAGGAASVSTFLSGSVVAPQAVELLAAPAGGSDFLIAARPAGQGLGVWELGTGGGLTARAVVGDGEALAAEGISSLAAVTVGGATFVVAGSFAEGLQVWRLSAAGTLTAVDRQGSAEGVPIAGVSALRSVTAGGDSWVIAAAAGSSSLTAFHVGADGRLAATDQVMDDLNTRFDAVTALDAIVVGGRVFVVAAGADAGLSLFTLCPKGRFVHLSTLADTAAMGLTGISAIEMVRVGAEVQVIVGSGAEAGLTVLRLDLAGIGAVVAATGAMATGGSGADLLWRSTGAGTIEGGAGDDILIDGEGSDALRGGTGADLFVMWADGVRDTILDFDPAQDRIDLSQWPMLRNTAQIAVTPTASGAMLRFWGEVLDIRTAAGTTLSVAQVQALALLPVTRVLLDFPDTGEEVAGTDATEMLAGGDGDDTLRGGGGDDTLQGRGGADRLEGGVGTDWASYLGAVAPVRVDQGDPSRNVGEAEGDLFESIEVVEGSAWADTLMGGAGPGRLVGRSGDDVIGAGVGGATLEGNAGHDRLAGGAGADWLFGGDGDDTGDGGAGSDQLRGGDGVDALDGGAGSDRLWGDAGNDLLSGGAGQDTLDGGAGDDRLAGGEGPDLLDGGEGVDVASWADAVAGVVVNLSDGTAGGAALGDVLRGIEGLEGSAHADRLIGDAGANRLSGLVGKDRLAGGAGDDRLAGGAGGDLVSGGTGNDTLSGQAGRDRLRGLAGDDVASGGIGNDRLRGGAGADDLDGGAGHDRGTGGAGGDDLWGGAGADRIAGGAGADRLWGGAGEDRLDGGRGGDRLWGGEGADVFVFGRSTAGDADVVLDFADGTDRLAFLSVPGADDAARFAAVAVAADDRGGVSLTVGGREVFLAGVSVAQIDASDFLWA